MVQLIHKRVAYERRTGEKHIFEAYRQAIAGAAPYVIMMDGAFWATAESGRSISEEIDDTIQWFGWKQINPIFA